MEVILGLRQYRYQWDRFLHVCGGDPWSRNILTYYVGFSPRMWRWSLTRLTCQKVLMVFSTYVEVILSIKEFQQRLESFLHVCGGDPTVSTIVRQRTKFSPRMWRWSSVKEPFDPDDQVFSTYVEVIPKIWVASSTQGSFLHVCGGDPKLIITFLNYRKVFSTYVEVILSQTPKQISAKSFLHVCGGDPRLV